MQLTPPSGLHRPRLAKGFFCALLSSSALLGFFYLIKYIIIFFWFKVNSFLCILEIFKANFALLQEKTAEKTLPLKAFTVYLSFLPACRAETAEMPTDARQQKEALRYCHRLRCDFAKEHRIFCNDVLSPTHRPHGPIRQSAPLCRRNRRSCLLV